VDVGAKARAIAQERDYFCSGMSSFLRAQNVIPPRQQFRQIVEGSMHFWDKDFDLSSSDDAAWRALSDRVLFPGVYLITFQLPLYLGIPEEEQTVVEYDLIFKNGDDKEVSYGAETYRSGSDSDTLVPFVVVNTYEQNAFPWMIETSRKYSGKLQRLLHRK
jgi:hypothetical protein